ncbi:hypothetical protein BD769DRAFT_1673575 [Suillus cothurnatus]|nr:hypothetical protein BD769DRAFT_1673575 [Suillus cothurnatus]
MDINNIKAGIYKNGRESKQVGRATYFQHEPGMLAKLDSLLPASVQAIQQPLVFATSRKASLGSAQGLAPPSIGQVSLDFLNWLFHTLRRHCPKLRLCRQLESDQAETTHSGIIITSRRKVSKWPMNQHLSQHHPDFRNTTKASKRRFYPMWRSGAPVYGLIIEPIATSSSAYSATRLELVVTDSELHKPEPPKKRQPSSKLMRVTANITARNLCALDWQQNSNQTEPACVFAAYWNKLSNADKEVCKRKAATARFNSSQWTRGAWIAALEGGAVRSRMAGDPDEQQIPYPISP